LEEIEIRELKKVNVEGGTIIDGFPGLDLTSSIVSTYLIQALQLDQVACIDSEFFPPISMVYATKPKFPARIYASEGFRLVVFLAEFTPFPRIHRNIAKRILRWAREMRCEQIITIVGAISEEEEAEAKEPVIRGVGSTPQARRKLTDANVDLLEIGMIPGIPGVLLNEGRYASFDVMALLTTFAPEIQSFRSAAKIVEFLDRMLPWIKIDVKPLYRQAEEIENRLNELRKRVTPVQPPELQVPYA
jgi:uncharacterized protein